MSDNTLEQQTTQESTEGSQETAQAKTYTQDEFNSHMAKLRTSLERKFEKQLADLGDLNELRELRKQQTETKEKDAISRGEFESVLKEHLSKKDQEIQKRDEIIRNYKIDLPLVNAAAKHKAINTDQVRSLVKNNLRLNTEGEVEVIDDSGKVRYSDTGDLLTVDEYIKEFLTQNPHFVSPTPSTTHSKSNFVSAGKLDISKLDMRNPEDRKKFKEAKMAGKI